MRGIIISIAVGCYAAALIITIAAMRLPVPGSYEQTQALAAAPEAPPLLAAPSPSTTAPAVVAETSPAPAPEANRAAVNRPSKEDALLLLARKHQKAGDVKTAEAAYLRLLRQGKWRGEAARRLGDLYFSAGNYGRAKEMYREETRILRER